jgi:hypothetical protein
MTMVDKTMDVAVTQALERKPAVAVPADFAAKVRLALPPRPVARKRVRVGRTVAVIAAVVLAVAMFALAPHAPMSFASLAFDLELALMVQLVGIVYWLAARQGIRD